MPDQDPTPDATDNNETGTEDDWGFLTPATIRRINRLTPGVLTMHFSRRDVSLVMQGSDAVRLLTAYDRGRADDLTDELDPASSLMLLGWVTLDVDKVLAMSWLPGPDADKLVAEGLTSQRGTTDKEE